MPRWARWTFLALLTLVFAFYFKSSVSQRASVFLPLQAYFPLPDHPVKSQGTDPSVSTPAFSRSIVAIGDLHGDKPNALKVLQLANVVDADGNWSGGVDVFVQTGDIIDR